jgi:hypothetical protein
MESVVSGQETNAEKCSGLERFAIDAECCDGSDEWNGKVTCRNRCKEVGEEHRQRLAHLSRVKQEVSYARYWPRQSGILTYRAGAAFTRKKRKGRAGAARKAQGDGGTVDK